jgi:hypothetical protein
MTIGSRRLPVADCRLPVGSCQLPVGSWQLAKKKKGNGETEILIGSKFFLTLGKQNLLAKEENRRAPGKNGPASKKNAFARERRKSARHEWTNGRADVDLLRADINRQGYMEPCPFAHFARENIKAKEKAAGSYWQRLPGKPVPHLPIPPIIDIGP